MALLIPTAGGWISLARVFPGLPPGWKPWAPLAAGAALYALVHWAFRRPLGLYVFGHELTHAAAALLSGYKVKSLFISGKGGEVELSDTNVAVALAPYCVPIYTLGVVLLYLFVDYYAAFSSPPPWVGAAVGFTYAFHAALTVHALRERQPDLKHAGVIFSLSAILFSNTLVLAGILKLLFPAEVSFPGWALGALADTRFLIERAGDFLEAAGRWAVERIRELRG